MNKIYILALLLSLGQSSWAQIREFQTTRLHSTSGAGVASILSTEAAVLNPASSAFFMGSSSSYQTYSTSLRNEHDDRATNNDDFAGHNKSQGLFISDHDGPVKGGVAYITQDENNFERKHFIMHGAAPIGDRTALGFAYRYLQDIRPKSLSPRHQTHHQMSSGLTHVLDESTVLALVIIDPTRTTPDEERLIGGFQYTFGGKFTLIGDVGTQYTKDVKDKYLWRGALQFNIFDDFFIRAGKFYDNIRGEKGSSWGIGWIGPRLGIEFSQRFSDQFSEDGYIYQDEGLVDTAVSAIIKF